MNKLDTRCKSYIEKGPPAHMADYVPGSLTEIIIAHGAQGKTLDAELSEIAQIIGADEGIPDSVKDPQVRAYLLEGRQLVLEVLGALGSGA
ncbi:MAG: hypothetical protein OSA97_01850 [Nevskia sp.]|nr:hypothetical protein [Nevskia sp.]